MPLPESPYIVKRFSALKVANRIGIRIPPSKKLKKQRASLKSVNEAVSSCVLDLSDRIPTLKT